MPINFKFAYECKGKRIFVPNDECVRRGEALIKYCSQAVDFPSYFYHYRAGGHVAALHRHLEHRFFFRIDIENFFYSISRNRVSAVLHHIGFRKARPYAEWSCVKNPFGAPAYSLPIGFVQSPMLASLAILRSPVAAAIERAAAAGAFVSVYFDDFIGSAVDREPLEKAFQDILHSCQEANLISNQLKLAKPSEHILAFNCDLSHGIAEVAEARVAKFFKAPRSQWAEAAFREYCNRVARNNHKSEGRRFLR